MMPTRPPSATWLDPKRPLPATVVAAGMALADSAIACLGPAAQALLEQLFDPLDDFVYFLKDREGRYRSANHSLWRRCGLKLRGDLIGRTSAELFPAPMGEAFMHQDRVVLDSGQALLRHLELHVYPDLRAGWCLTHKLPVHQPDGQVCGLVGISRDLGLPDRKHPEYQQIAQIATRLQTDYAQPLQLGQLAREAGLSLDRVERMFHRVFQLTPREMLVQARVDAARARLAAPGPVSMAELALDCGYADQSAFTRQFKATVGLTPSQYRQLHAAG